MGNFPNHDQFLPLFSESFDTLPTGKDESSVQQQRTILQSRERLGCFLVISLQALALLVLAISGSAFKNINGVQCKCPTQFVEPSLVYSPAQNVVEYEIKTFGKGYRHSRSIYQGWGDDVDSAWDELYNNEIMKIPKSEAILLPNKTYPVEDEPGYYVASLDVFHQLHCLNLIRRAIHKHHYVEVIHLQDHVSHCVDSVRQSLMCNADISVNVWQWNATKGSVEPHFTQLHSCKSFDKLKDWVKKRRLQKMFNKTHFIDDDLPDVPIIH